MAGAPSSISQFTTLPLASVTSMYSRPCGLIHSTFVTGPLSVIGLLRSYCAENEWCAWTGTFARIRTRIAHTDNDQYFMDSSFLDDCSRTAGPRGPGLRRVARGPAYFGAAP